MANPIMWFEIIGKDSAGLQKFYRDTFGWKMTAPIKEMGNYSMLSEQGPNDKGAGGGIGGDPNDGALRRVATLLKGVARGLHRGARR